MISKNSSATLNIFAIVRFVSEDSRLQVVEKLSLEVGGDRSRAQSGVLSRSHSQGDYERGAAAVQEVQNLPETGREMATRILRERYRQAHAKGGVHTGKDT